VILRFTAAALPRFPRIYATCSARCRSPIHGRLLTAWSTAAIAGPNIVTYIREYQLGRGIAKADAYSVAIYVMVGVLAIGFLCNLLTRPVHERHHYDPAKGPAAPHPAAAAVPAAASAHAAAAVQALLASPRDGGSSPHSALWVCIDIPVAGAVYKPA
jgi:hypothetical protein